VFKKGGSGKQTQSNPQKAQRQPSLKPKRNDSPDKNNSDKKFDKPCFRCTRLHDPTTCVVAKWDCKYCHQKGHIVKTCPVKNKKSKVQVNSVHTGNGSSVDDDILVDSLLDFE